MGGSELYITWSGILKDATTVNAYIMDYYQQIVNANKHIYARFIYINNGIMYLDCSLVD